MAQARSVAAEDACLALCPLIYRENLRTLNIHQARIAKPALTDPSVADRLLLDDRASLNWTVRGDGSRPDRARIHHRQL